MNWGLLALVVAVAIAVNLPFGAWRTTTRKLSWQWFLAIHLPIPAIFIIRRAAGFGWAFVPLMVACAVTGQLLGGWLYARLRPGRIDASGRGYGPFPSEDGAHGRPDLEDAQPPAESARHDAPTRRLDMPPPEPATIAVEGERATR